MKMNFPLYVINHPHELSTEGDVVLCGGAVVDDKSIDAPTLSERRLRLLADGVELYPLRRSVDSYGDLVKYSTGGDTGRHTYIDVFGKVVRYVKEQRRTVITKPIAEVVQCVVDNTVHIRREGETIFMQVRRRPGPSDLYAIAAITSGGLLFLGYSEVPLTETKLMI